jgi:hypothetical protein
VAFVCARTGAAAPSRPIRGALTLADHDAAHAFVPDRVRAGPDELP